MYKTQNPYLHPSLSNGSFCEWYSGLLGAPYKVPPTRWLKKWKFTVSQFWGLEVWDERVGRVLKAVWENLLCFSPHFSLVCWQLLPILGFSKHHSNLCLHIHVTVLLCECLWVPNPTFYKDTRNTELKATLIPVVTNFPVKVTFWGNRVRTSTYNMWNLRNFFFSPKFPWVFWWLVEFGGPLCRDQCASDSTLGILTFFVLKLLEKACGANLKAPDRAPGRVSSRMGHAFCFQVDIGHFDKRLLSLLATIPMVPHACYSSPDPSGIIYPMKLKHIARCLCWNRRPDIFKHFNLYSRTRCSSYFYTFLWRYPFIIMQIS